MPFGAVDVLAEEVGVFGVIGASFLSQRCCGDNPVDVNVDKDSR